MVLISTEVILCFEAKITCDNLGKSMEMEDRLHFTFLFKIKKLIWLRADFYHLQKM